MRIGSIDTKNGARGPRSTLHAVHQASASRYYGEGPSIAAVAGARGDYASFRTATDRRKQDPDAACSGED